MRLPATSCLSTTTFSLTLLASSALAGAQRQAPFSSSAAPLQQLSGQASLNEFPNFASSAKMAQPDNVDDPSSLAKERIADAQQLFGAKPNIDIFKRSWAPDAIFEDPICYATGWKQYASQWWAMQLFSKSTTSAWRITKDTPTEIQYVQKQVYGIDRFNFEKVMHSTVVMKLDEQGRIKHFQDRWDHKDMPGAWAYPLRRLNAYAMPLFISKPDVHPDYQGGAQGKKEL